MTRFYLYKRNQFILDLNWIKLGLNKHIKSINLGSWVVLDGMIHYFACSLSLSGLATLLTWPPRGSAGSIKN